MLKKTFVGTLMLGAALLMQGSVLAHANEVCNSIQECNDLIASARNRIRELRSGRGGSDAVTAGMAARTTTDAYFGRVGNLRFFENTWRDQSGMIWGNAVKANGELTYMSQEEAIRYCQGIGAQLPTEEDFIRLREYMGAGPGTYRGYRPQILSDLEGVIYWVRPSARAPRSAFYGSNGGILNVEPMHESIVAVRCVMSP